MRSELKDFLAWQKSVTMEWGVCDCTLFCADWVEYLTGRDPAAPWRGTYSSRAGAQAHIAAAGGLPGFGGAIGWPRVRGEPQAGDIAVLVIRAGPNVPGPIASARFGVFTGNFWAIKPDGVGVQFMRRGLVRVLEMWRHDHTV